MTVKVAPEMWFLQGPATDVEANKLRTSAAAFRRMLDGLMSARQGVVYTRGTCTDLKALATGTPDGFIHVQAGACYVRGTQAADQGMYHLYNDATLDINVLGPNPAHATLDRIDLVVARFQDQFYSGSLDVPTIEMVTGTPAGSPTVPAAPANSLILAQLSIIHATSTIPQSVITDRRVPAGNSIVLLDDILVGTDSRYPTQASATDITFLNAAGVGTNLIPPGFSELEVLLDARSNGAVTAEVPLMQFNGDTTAANYDNQSLEGSNAAVAAAQAIGTAAGIQMGVLDGANSTASTSGLCRSRIVNPSSAVFHKNVESQSATFDTEASGGGRTRILAGRWINVAAITRITIKGTSGTQWAVGTRAILRGHVGLQP